MKVTVLGAGAWGTALASLLHRGGHTVTIWGHNAAHLDDVRATGRNERYLPGIELPRDWMLQSDLAKAIAGAEVIVASVPSKAFREVTRSLVDFSRLKSAADPRSGSRGFLFHARPLRFSALLFRVSFNRWT